MNIEIHNPELEQRVLAQIRSGHFHDAAELFAKALDALEEKNTPVPAQPGAVAAPAPRKNLVELFDPIRGLLDDIDFTRNPSTARPLDL